MDEKALTELLECSVCLEQLDETSKVLPCQHTFCRRCLEGIVNSKRELRCPECRLVVETRLDELPANILLIRLLESMKLQASSAAQAVGTHKRQQHSHSAGSLTVRLPKQPSTGVSTSQPCAKALYNYEAKEPGDLSFKKGDILLLKRQVDENWFHGELQNQHGFFPASYVQVINPLPQEIPTCKALYDFVINDQNEKDCLTFKKDEMITVIRRVDDNWAEGKLGEKIGIFPISFVEMNDAAKWLVNSQIQNISPSPSSSGLTFYTNGAAVPPHPTVYPANSSAYILQHPSLASLKTTNHKRHSLTAITMGSATTKVSPARQNHRHSMEVPCLVDLTSSSTGTQMSQPLLFTHTAGLPHKSYLQHPQLPISTASVPVVSARQALAVTAPTVIYVALYNYKPQKEDEIELRKGDCYMVSEKCQDGWFKGSCLRTGKQGVFPGNYVRMIKPSTRQAGIGATGLKMGVSSSTSPSQPGTNRSHHRQAVPKTSPVESQPRVRVQGQPLASRNRTNGSPEENTQASRPQSQVVNSPTEQQNRDNNGEVSTRDSNGEVSTRDSNGDISERDNSANTGNADGSNAEQNNQLDDNGNITAEVTAQTSEERTSEASQPSSSQSSPKSETASKENMSDVGAEETLAVSLTSVKNDSPTAAGATLASQDSAESEESGSAKSASGSSPKKESSSKVPKLKSRSSESQSRKVVVTISSSLLPDSGAVPSTPTSSDASPGVCSITQPLTVALSPNPVMSRDTSVPVSLSSSYPVTERQMCSRELLSQSVETEGFPSGPSPPVPKRHPRSKSQRSRSRHLPNPPDPSSTAAQHSTLPTTNVKAPPNMVVGAEGGSSAASAALPLKVKKEKKERDKLSAALRKLTKVTKKSRSPTRNSESASSRGDSPASQHSRSESLPVDDGKGAVMVPRHRKTASSDGAAVPNRPSKPKPLIRERFRCIVPYPPQSEIELELKIGDVVYVHRKREDGWFKGTLQRTGKTGLFPGSFVESF